MKKRIIATIMAAACVSMILAGCGGGSSRYESFDEAPAAGKSFLNGADYRSDNIYEAAAEEAYYDEYSEYEEPEEARGNEENLNSVASTRKLIRNVYMDAQTKEFDALLAAVNARIESLGGYIENSNISGYSMDSDSYSTRYADLTIRIPSAKLDSFVNMVAEKSNITSKNENAEDVTLQYSDVTARIDSLRVEQKRLNELLEQADDLDVIVRLEERLTDVRYEIESYESRLRTLDNQVDYSTVHLSIQEVKDYTPVVTEEPTFWERFSGGFLESCEDAFEGLQDFLVWFVSVLPHLIVIAFVLAIIAGIVLLIIKASLKGSKKRKAKKAAKKERIEKLKAEAAAKREAEKAEKAEKEKADAEKSDSDKMTK